MASHSTCFLCLEHVSSLDPPRADKIHNEGSSERNYLTPEKISLKSICRQLRVNPQLVSTTGCYEGVADEKRWDFSVALCKQCSNIIVPLSNLCVELELIEMKMSHYLNSVIGVMIGTVTDEEESLVEEFPEALRKEIKKKCQIKLSHALPKVELAKDFTEQRPGHHQTNKNSPTKIKTVKKEQALSKIKDTQAKIPASNCSTENGGKRYIGKTTCGICGKAYRSRASLWEHNKVVHEKVARRGRVTCVCDVCGKVFQHIKSLRDHKLSRHTEGGAGLKCEDCGKVFRLPQGLRTHAKLKHQKIVSLAKRYESKCNVCGTVFQYKEDLRRHMFNAHGDVMLTRLVSTGGGGKDAEDNESTLLKRDAHEVHQDSDQASARIRKMNPDESEPVPQTYILPKSNEVQDIEYLVEGSKVKTSFEESSAASIHRNGMSDDEETVGEPESQFFVRDEFDGHSSDVEVEMKVVVGD